MSEQILQRGNAVERSRTRTIAQVAIKWSTVYSHAWCCGRSIDES